MTIRGELHALADGLQDEAVVALLDYARWLAGRDATITEAQRRGPVVDDEMLVREIADDREAAADLGASEDRLWTVLDNAPLILFAVDGAGRSTMRAGRGLTILAARNGFPSTHHAGQSPYEVYDDHPQMQANLKRALDGESFNSIVEIDGRIFDCAYGPIRDANGELDGAVSVATDVTEREQARRNLQGLQDEHELILQSAGEGIYGQDCQGLTTFVNPAAARMLGWPVDELIGRDTHTTLHATRVDGSPYPQESCPIHASVADGGVHHASGELFWRRNGTAFPVEYICAPIYDGSQIVGAVVTFKDISERRAAEEERARLYQKLLERDKELHDAIGTVLLSRSTGYTELGERDQLARLTQRERDVLERVTLGQTNAEIALALDMGVGTVKSHVEHLLKKLSLVSRTQAAVWADRLGPAAFTTGEARIPPPKV